MRFRRFKTLDSFVRKKQAGVSVYGLVIGFYHFLGKDDSLWVKIKIIDQTLNFSEGPAFGYLTIKLKSEPGFN